MAIWPCLAIERGPSAPWALRLEFSAPFTVIVAAAAAWFLLELHAHGEAGLAERVVTGLQALWPVIVVVCLRSTPQRVGQPVKAVDDQMMPRRRGEDPAC
jgi:hypothetical protein